MELIDDNIMRSICPWSYFHFIMFPSIGASGKSLIAWNGLYCQKLDEFVGRFSTCPFLRCSPKWEVATSVYSPTNASVTQPWILDRNLDQSPKGLIISRWILALGHTKNQGTHHT